MDVLSDGTVRREKRVWIALILLQLSTSCPAFSWAQQPLEDPIIEVQVAPESAAPYVVFVAETAAFTRCGPGLDHYRTEPLRRGQELEVYVETDAGWLGVRPPEESFCWMPADAVQLSSDSQTATIIEDDTVAWIGTRLGQAKRYRWQVQLDAGENVVVLGQTERQSESGSKSWLRIVPPSGEFRWIHRDQIVESAEQLAEKIASQTLETENQNKVAMAGLESSNDANDAEPLQVLDSDQADPIDSAGDMLQAAGSIPDLRPAPGQSSSPDDRIVDRALQFHRGARAEDYQDRGAVIGSGLKSQWKDPAVANGEVTLATDESSQSVLSNERLSDLPSSGAAAAAAAITMPLKKMSDVVANFISPPRIVAIDTSQSNAFTSPSLADRRWMVGSDRRDDSRLDVSMLSPPNSLAAAPYESTSPSSALAGPQVLPASASFGSQGVSGTVSTAGATLTPTRIVTVQQIARVDDAVNGANIDSLGQILSKLMAEAASAEEITPLIRRIDTLLRSGDVNHSTQTRDLLDLAQRYQNVAARRDGVTMIQSQSLATITSPALMSTVGVNPAAVPASQPASATPYEPHLSQSLLPDLTALPRSSNAAIIESPLAPVTGSATGYLVQVYSSRADSPPFALTDDAGLTIAYVTPYPGVNLRNHLNSRIAVSGSEKLLEGMSTPHILVDRAMRR